MDESFGRELGWKVFEKRGWIIIIEREDVV